MSERFLLIVMSFIVHLNYWNRLLVAETILVIDNGGHSHAILHEVRFVLAKNARVSRVHAVTVRCDGARLAVRRERNRLHTSRADIIPLRSTVGRRLA